MVNSASPLLLLTVETRTQQKESWTEEKIITAIPGLKNQKYFKAELARKTTDCSEMCEPHHSIYYSLEFKI
jgi:hypothetical protein